MRFNSKNDGDIIDLGFLNDQEFTERTRLSLNWIKLSIDVNKGKGSSAYYSNLYKPFTWTKAYPETTGYIIPTLLDYHELYPDLELKKYAMDCVDWLCSLQHQNGALPGGLSGSKEPSVFNTGQMLIGLNRVYKETQNKKYLQVIDKAVNWLITILEKDGSWNSSSYVHGYIPSYYTRIVWPVLWSNNYLQRPEIDDAMKKALHYYKKKITPQKSVKDWSFRKGQKAFTHTIAYTIRGFFESSLILNDDDLKVMSIALADKVLRLREINGRLAGWYDENWKGDYWFTCVTGNAQLCVLFNRIYQCTGDIRFLNTALKLFEDIVNKQKKSGVNSKGAIPGSSPFFGRYLIFRYPNWAAKFYLDAYLLLKENLEILSKTHLSK